MKQFWIFDFGFWINESRNKKLFCLALSTLLFALSFSAWAQQETKLHCGFDCRLACQHYNRHVVHAFMQGLDKL
jgi:hypothetical protein